MTARCIESALDGKLMRNPVSVPDSDVWHDHCFMTPQKLLITQSNPLGAGMGTHADPKPFDAVIAVTYRCNARCQMCNIWQVRDHDDCKPDDYRIIPTSLKHIN